MKYIIIKNHIFLYEIGKLKKVIIYKITIFIYKKSIIVFKNLFNCLLFL
jgi:hypothetical protein